MCFGALMLSFWQCTDKIFKCHDVIKYLRHWLFHSLHSVTNQVMHFQKQDTMHIMQEKLLPFSLNAIPSKHAYALCAQLRSRWAWWWIPPCMVLRGTGPPPAPGLSRCWGRRWWGCWLGRKESTGGLESASSVPNWNRWSKPVPEEQKREYSLSEIES